MMYFVTNSEDFGSKGGHANGKEFVVTAEEAQAWNDKNMLQK
jgi:hypothetical protein